MNDGGGVDIKIKSKIAIHLGYRDGWGKATHVSGYSHFVQLECGHRTHVPNSRYDRQKSVRCDSCEEAERDIQEAVRRYR